MAVKDVNVSVEVEVKRIIDKKEIAKAVSYGYLKSISAENPAMVVNTVANEITELFEINGIEVKQ